MQVQVSGKHVDVGEALRVRVSDEINTIIGKFFDRGGGSADVVVTKDGYAFRVDCAVTLASGQYLQSHGLGGDAHAAFDAALDKIATRVRRYKNRLKDHSASAAAKQAEVAAAYTVLRSPDDEGEDWGAVDGHAPPEAMIIAETEEALKTMTVSMAVMELDLTESRTIVFRNAAHGGLSVVYRRADGNIGWIDPERTQSQNGNGTRAHA